MKYLLMLIALFSTPVLATTMTCSSGQTTAIFIVKEGLLLDTNENVLAPEIRPNTYRGEDINGTVLYTVNSSDDSTNILMQFDGITKEYTCLSKY